MSGNSYPDFRQVIRRIFDASINAIRVTLIPSSGSIKITNINNPAINTELTHVLQTNVRKIIIKSRKLATIRVAFAAGGTTAAYIEIPDGGYLELNDLVLPGATLYYRIDKSNRVLEILEQY